MSKGIHSSRFPHTYLVQCKWGVVTLTTVGYGDVYPINLYAKILGGNITLLGVGLIALPSGILASGYTEQILRKKGEQK